ncbi:DUF4249 domain-containing protein [Flavobacterium johnsoniae]|uniref:Hypothetical lipoprotein n=1 Tax=Flavobacterium johnsoniae (strain ATCC 17061 / DSM 2064 / JCM 8514 / BCRC 14874 / CCUG 350202 / NBRC 14942 / NCIMB 11054 / UW101) TaxID=376686 RepID=A5FJZ7_FLAJ1|nr:DUF4249 domain-containing protein [Flavobacterium johnsoniae]ABQ04469.1 hypothetical lipoprotein [Flavobacterium johnsoniae UW101]OXE97795.1 hypothetical protein B0A63_16825 [Flavobacterium johnsoniae UW101]WQG83735.1 DUF4249 domain-containing protein [Flavobacterium johnsoniae UW101]SHK23259.1 protein of unknown function [Flavobacterium johnsoniae]
MKNYSQYKTAVLLVIAIAVNGCTETYPLITNRFEDVLIVEANLTNELKKQEVKLTKSAKFEDESYLSESGAEVFVTDDAGNKFNFSEDSEKYISNIEFKASANTKYQLHINTKDGRSFESSPEILTTATPMQSVVAAVEQKDDITGIGIRVNSFDPTSTSTYYRFEYEETYKVIAPKWLPIKLDLSSGSPAFVSNSSDTKTCYGSKKSVELMLLNTNNLKEDRVQYLIRFISNQDYIITHRYSILVKQYVESLPAYSYYNTLNKTAESGGTITSPTQPGLLLGNLRSINGNSKIAGYFDVCSVSTERIYFNWEDLFPGKFPPPYYTDCTQFCYAEEPNNPVPCTHCCSYMQDLPLEKITYFSGDGINNLETFWVDAPCGDCTKIASNIKPTFWVDN